jgi:mannose-1-phosphate guanylyltransferase
MKALILSAGLGTRLRPLTETIPKPLVPINGKPLLAYHLEWLQKFGVTDVLINTHYLHEQIDEFVVRYKEMFPGLIIQTAFEESLLGSAGTLQKNADFFDGEESFLIVYGDNLTNINYEKLLATHKEKKGIATIAVYYENHPETKGVITFDTNGTIRSFIEKPQGKVESNYANAGLYVLDRRVLDYLKLFEKLPLDFGFDVFPFLLEKNEKMHVYMMDEVLLDIGTLESYNKSQELAADIF